MDHITKVENAQNGLLRHIKDLNNQRSNPALSAIEHQALQQELCEASKLLDYTEQFVPRPRPIDPVKPINLKGPDQ